MVCGVTQVTDKCFTSSLQNFLSMEVEELEQNNQISLSVERKRGTFGRLTVHWAADGSLTDIYPTSGVVRNPLLYVPINKGNVNSNRQKPGR